jgi:hypothetical protein
VFNELGITAAIDNRTYTPTTFSKDEILQNHASVLIAVDLQLSIKVFGQTD